MPKPEPIRASGRPETLAATWFQTHPVRRPAPLAEVLQVLRSTPLPATLAILDARSGLGVHRLRSALADLEARGQVQLNRRGDAVFAITDPGRPVGGNPHKENNHDAYAR